MAGGNDGGTELKAWIGRTETMTELVAARPVAALNATLDRGEALPSPGDPLPPLYHWLYFLPLAETAELDADGHPRRGGFLPPVTLPRRMWASSDVAFTGPIRIGEEATRSSVIEDIAEKQGRTGPLVFVTIRHEIACADGIAITDRQTIVYRGVTRDAAGGGGPPAGRPAPGTGDFSRTITPSAALLFRYSALIFNAHRIHYDHPFTTEVEGYPALVVHGPLLATLLADLVRRALPDVSITRFRFRAVAPVFDDAPFTICGRRDGEHAVALWVRDGAGDLCVDAAAELG
ncbi:MAG: acyl-CoA dehydrogenase [Alphaproteobacteria bacterium]|nr:MaoC family dehydratase N-terminal domain-containing protein [Pseudomonadota bacterium]TDI64399.1 MAG: acyl-CoA dehydrogenase [Alphaproteobacteria bacterium]